MASVHIVVPCYNYARFIKTCATSVLSQRGVDVKLLIINDASTDESARVCDEIAAEDRRVKVIHHPKNQGHIATYNEGLAAADADYVVLLSADDLLTPGCLARATAIMEENPSVGFVYGNAIKFTDTLPPAKQDGLGRPIIWTGREWLRLMCEGGRCFIHSPEVVMRTSIQRQIGLYNPDLPQTGDMEMWMRAALHAGVARLDGVDQAYYRLHPSSMQHTLHAGPLLDLYAKLKTYELVLGRASFLEAEEYLSRARKRLANDSLWYVLNQVRMRRPMTGTIDEYCSFAERAFPGIVESKNWHRAQEYRTRRASIAETLLWQIRLALRRLTSWRHRELNKAA